MYINPNLCWDASKSLYDFSELMKNSKANDEKLEKIIMENQEVKEIKKEVKVADKEKTNLENDSLVDIFA